MKTKIEILEETAAFYNSENRSVKPNGACAYFGPKGRRCAFSRCLPDDFKCDETTPYYNLLSYLKPEYQGHGADFWADIQMLHDNELFWVEEGLSASGERHLQSLKERWNEDEN